MVVMDRKSSTAVVWIMRKRVRENAMSTAPRDRTAYTPIIIDRRICSLYMAKKGRTNTKRLPSVYVLLRKVAISVNARRLIEAKTFTHSTAI
jgi:hypothetical protein